MATTFTGNIDVKRTAELGAVSPATIRNHKFLLDLLSSDDSVNATFDAIESALLHNNIGTKQGGTAGEYYHLTNAQNGIVTDLFSQVVADEASRPALGNTNLFYYAISEASLSYWDGAIIAAAQRLEAATLYSEDLNDGQVYGTVRVVNPYL